jgi:hypothetical protein
MGALTRPDCNEFSDARKRKWSSVGQAGRQVRTSGHDLQADRRAHFHLTFLARAYILVDFLPLRLKVTGAEKRLD